MPKKVVTKSNWNNGVQNGAVAVENIANAVAEAMGCQAVKNGDSYEISISPLGYDDSMIIFTLTSNNKLAMVIQHQMWYSASDEGWPLFTGSNNTHPYLNTYTAVCARDSNNDTVVVSVVPGQDISRIEGDIAQVAPIVMFAARDVNGGILFGCGKSGHIRVVANESFRKDVYDIGTATHSYQLSSGVLHLAKMVNYFAPGAPEMKSAYVSVARPFDNDLTENERNLSFYAGEKTWFVAGNSCNGDNLYPSIEPIVNY